MKETTQQATMSAVWSFYYPTFEAEGLLSVASINTISGHPCNPRSFNMPFTLAHSSSVKYNITFIALSVQFAAL